jgi:hypothetical protein
MAVLPTNDRIKINTGFQQESSSTYEALALTKADLQAAVDAIDAWADANAASFNSAIPLPARTALTTRQKARLLALVLQRRYEVS